MTILFISGIDTNIGKSVACGALANSLIQQGLTTCTQKWIETGCENESQDLLTHQSMVESQINQHDISLHAPYCFKFPASPHLAASLEKQKIEASYLLQQTQQLSEKCDHLLIEGAGGLCVPIDANILLIDLLAQMQLPVLLVTSGRLGSINQTLLSLALCEQRKVEVRAIIYNQYPTEDATIVADTREWLQNYLRQKNLSILWLELEQQATSIAINQEQLQLLLAD